MDLYMHKHTAKSCGLTQGLPFCGTKEAYVMAMAIFTFELTLLGGKGSFHSAKGYMTPRYRFFHFIFWPYFEQEQFLSKVIQASWM